MRYDSIALSVGGNFKTHIEHLEHYEILFLF